MLGNTNSFTNTLADRDQLIGDVITNLNDVLGTINDKGDQFAETTIDELPQWSVGWRRTVTRSVNAIPEIAGRTADLAVAAAERPSATSRPLIGETNRTMTQLDLGKDDINTRTRTSAVRLPEADPSGRVRSFFQFYLCANTFKFSGPDGTTIMLPTARPGHGKVRKSLMSPPVNAIRSRSVSSVSSWPRQPSVAALQYDQLQFITAALATRPYSRMRADWSPATR